MGYNTVSEARRLGPLRSLDTTSGRTAAWASRDEKMPRFTSKILSSSGEWPGYRKISLQNPDFAGRAAGHRSICQASLDPMLRWCLNSRNSSHPDTESLRLKSSREIKPRFSFSPASSLTPEAADYLPGSKSTPTR